MARKHLKSLLDRIISETQDKDSDYRDISNTYKHRYKVVLSDLIHEIESQITGVYIKSKDSVRYTLTPEQKNIIKEECQRYFNTVSRSFPSTNNFTSDIIASDSEHFIVDISCKKEFSNNVFGFIKRYRKPALDTLRINLLNRLRESGVEHEATLEQRVSGGYNQRTGERSGGLLDLGHLKGVSVSEQRVSRYLKDIDIRANSIINRKGKVQNNPLIELNMDLESNPDLKHLKKLTVEAVLVKDQGKTSNAQQSAQERALLRTVGDRINKILSDGTIDWANFKTSPSAIEMVEGLIHKAAKKAGANKYDKTAISNLAKSKVRHRLKGELKQTITEIDIKDNINVSGNIEVKGKKAPNWSSIVAIINARLTPKIIANMKYPRLENRTGTFASSVSVVGVEQTPQGFPSFIYNYQRDPYDVFDPVLGASPWNTPERDPKTLITQSIREIVAELAIGRFYTRRAY